MNPDGVGLALTGVVAIEFRPQASDGNADHGIDLGVIGRVAFEDAGSDDGLFQHGPAAGQSGLHQKLEQLANAVTPLQLCTA
jgi:hypothetical protein